MLRRQRLGGGRVEVLDDASLARDFSVAAAWYSIMLHWCQIRSQGYHAIMPLKLLRMTQKAD